MHVLHIYKDYPPVLGGIELHLRDLAEAQAARGHTVTVLVTAPGRQTSVERPAPNLTVIRAGRALHVASTPLSPEQLRLARGLRADIVHLQFPYPPGDIAALAVPGGPPLVVSYQSDIVRQRSLLRLYRPLLSHTLRRAARIIVSSPEYLVSSPFLREHAARCAIIPIGVDVWRFRPEEAATNGRSCAVRDPAVLLFVGRLRYYKGLHVLVEALREVPGAQLQIAGEGPERGRLEAQVAAAGLGERVRFLGDVPEAELPALLRRADLFVLPSHLRAEALGIAQIEALASGVPCISTELGTGTSFANRHGETGLVVPPGDPAALAAAINTLLADPALRAHMGRAARRRALALFDRQRMIERVEHLYADVVRRG